MQVYNYGPLCRTRFELRGNAVEDFAEVAVVVCFWIIQQYK